MTAGPLATLLDYVGNRVAAGIPGVTAVYSAHASDNPDRVLWIPDSIDAEVTCLVWPGAGAVTAGNTESYVYDVDLHYWVNRALVGQALATAVGCIDATLPLLRRDITAGGHAAWVQQRGHQGPGDEVVNGVSYLVATVNLQLLVLHFSHDYTTDI